MVVLFVSWGCSDVVSPAELPGEPGGLAMLLRATSEGRPAEVVSVVGEQPFLHEGLAVGESMHVLRISQDNLRTVHPAAALDLPTIQRADLGPLPDMECQSEVSEDGREFITPMPESAFVMSFDTDQKKFAPSTVSASELVGARALVLPLGVEPCRLAVTPSPLEISGVFRTNGDTTEYSSVYQVNDTKVVATSSRYLYVYERGQPERSLLLSAGPLRTFFPAAVVGFELADRTIYVAALRNGDPPDFTGGIAWFEDDGTNIRYLHHVPTDKLAYSVAVSSQGDIAVTTGSFLVTGTVTSTAIRLTEFPGIGELNLVAFSGDDEFVLSSRSILFRLGFPGFGLIEQHSLQEDIARANGSRVSGIGFSGDDIFVSTFSQGVHRLTPGLAVSHRLPLGVAQSVNPCNDNRTCNGADTFRTIASMSLLSDAGGQNWVFFAHSRCSMISALHVSSGCTTDFAVKSPSVLHARPHRLVIAGNNEVLEIRNEDLPQL